MISSNTIASLLGKKSPCLQLQPKALLHCEWTCPQPELLEARVQQLLFRNIRNACSDLHQNSSHAQLQLGLIIMTMEFLKKDSVMCDSSCQFQQSRVSSERVKKNQVICQSLNDSKRKKSECNSTTDAPSCTRHRLISNRSKAIRVDVASTVLLEPGDLIVRVSLR